MPEAYSLDLRERVARFVEGGRSCHAAAALFSVSVSFVVRLMKSFRATGGLAPKPSGGRRHAKLDPHRVSARPHRRKSRHYNAGTRS
jgi:transposase